MLQHLKRYTPQPIFPSHFHPFSMRHIKLMRKVHDVAAIFFASPFFDFSLTNQYIPSCNSKNLQEKFLDFVKLRLKPMTGQAAIRYNARGTQMQ